MAVKKSSSHASQAKESKPKTARVKKEKKETSDSQNKKKLGNEVDMNMAFFLKKEDATPQWRVIDAEGQVLGRIATKIADILRGKDKPYFTPHVDCGDYVVVINAAKVLLTGDKVEKKEYVHYTGWIGGQKVTSARELLQKHPDRVITLAVKGMLPKNVLSRYLLRKLRVYAGSEHPHLAQKPELNKA